MINITRSVSDVAIQKKHRLRICCMLCGVLCLVLTGCISTNQYVERNQYLFDLPKNSGKVAAVSKTNAIFVDHVVAISPFDQLDFLYKVKSGQYLTDYYHGFVTPPAEQLDTILVANLRAKVNFKLYVREQLAAENRLKIELTELYADYSVRDKPQAVITMHLLLTQSRQNKTVVLSDQILRSSIALKAKNTDSLLDGWNAGIQDVIMQIARVLNQQLC